MSKKLLLGWFMMAMNCVMSPSSYEIERSGSQSSIPYYVTIPGSARLKLTIHPFQGYQATYMDALPEYFVHFRIDVLKNINSGELYHILNQAMNHIENMFPEDTSEKLNEDAINKILYDINNYMTQQSLSSTIRIHSGYCFSLENMRITQHTLDAEHYLEDEEV